MARNHRKLAFRWERYPKSMTAVFVVAIVARIANAFLQRSRQLRRS